MPRKILLSDALIIGSDQVTPAVANARQPGDHANATRQPAASAGKTADFHTAVALLDAKSGKAQSQVACRVTIASMTGRSRLTCSEQPYDCPERSPRASAYL
jgi:predicted house-cleaning NTP pyrophosphatase (Maf/HAM1 superfamily)